jgi:hypothetical protein
MTKPGFFRAIVRPTQFLGTTDAEEDVRVSSIPHATCCGELIMARQCRVQEVSLACVVLGAAAGLWLAHASGDEPKSSEQKPKETKRAEALSKFMREKLTASNQVMEGLVTEDFALIAKGAATMKRLSASEEWQISNDGSYRQHSNQFRRVVDQLEAKAKDKQLDGAALAWMQATMSCIECHKWVRSTIIAEK